MADETSTTVAPQPEEPQAEATEATPVAHAAPEVDAIAPPKVHPRSPRKRLLAQQETAAPRVKSQPITPPARPEPLVVPESEPELARGPWHWKPYFIGLALVAWSVALALVMTGAAQSLGSLGSPQRVVAGAWAFAALLTFGPLQWRLHLGGLTWQGVVGWTLLAYMLAFAPPPTGSLLQLPEIPTYLLLFLAVFYAAASAVFPIAFVIGQRLFKHRLQRLDVRRARRQGYEAGLLAVALLTLAGLRVLTPLTGALLAIVIVLLEMLLLSQVRPEG